jgi:photosystem II stability/assembly factor-like uncharacterized protein
VDSRSRAGARLAVLAALVFAARVDADTVPLREVRQSLFGACFATEQDGWMVGELGRIFHTTDGGQTWDRQDAHTKRPFLAVSCVDQRTAWIAGKEGIVYGTRDAGATWTQSPTGSARHVFTLQFVTPERGHGAGDFGTMVHTEDGGRSWTVQQVPNTIEMPPNAIDIGVDPGDVNLYALSYADPDHVWLTGEFGIVMASSDGGRTWQQQRSAVDTTLFGIHFADAQHGWAVGSDSVIVRTTDGGATWRTQQSPMRERPLYDVFVTGRNGWIVGEAGTVLKSTDGGANWGTEPLPIQLAARWIRSVWLTPGGRGLAVGAEGLVFLLDGAHLERLAHRPRPERDA